MSNNYKKMYNVLTSFPILKDFTPFIQILENKKQSEKPCDTFVIISENKKHFHKPNKPYHV